MVGTLYRWPPATAFGRVVPKTKFYEHATVGSKLRDTFTAEVRRVTWAHKLSPATINLPCTPEVPEIQVLAVDTKGEDVSAAILALIDKAIPSPIIFEIRTPSDQVRVTAAYQHRQGNRTIRSEYFTTDWLPADQPRQPLPPATDLGGLYAAILTPLLPLQPSPGEPLAQALDRLGKTKALQREIAALTRRINTEPQLNRKIELRRTLQDRVAALEALASTNQ